MMKRDRDSFSNVLRALTNSHTSRLCSSLVGISLSVKEKGYSCQ